MSIDLNSENLEPISELAKWDRLPKRRGGKALHPTTILRWATDGCRGIKLESVPIGATLCSSREALLRFFAALSAVRGISPPGAAEPESLSTTESQRLVRRTGATNSATKRRGKNAKCRN